MLVWYYVWLVHAAYVHVSLPTNLWLECWQMPRPLNSHYLVVWLFGSVTHYLPSNLTTETILSMESHLVYHTMFNWYYTIYIVLMEISLPDGLWMDGGDRCPVANGNPSPVSSRLASAFTLVDKNSVPPTRLSRTLQWVRAGLNAFLYSNIELGLRIPVLFTPETRPALHALHGPEW
jgi:hypothetical protein